jgi:hypothetical protein
MQEGNYWVLQSSLGDQKIIRCDPGTNNLLEVTGLSARDVTFYGSGKSSKLYRWDTVKHKPLRIVNLRPSRKRHSAFSAGTLPCDGLLLELAPVTETIRTQTGEYTGCSSLSIATADSSLPGCDLLSERIWFAPGVGPVEFQGRLDRLYRLVEAQVDGVVVGGP